MLKLTGITKIYDVADEKVVALNGVDVEFRKNEFVSVLGPSGCGKTTLLNIIGGLDNYTSGEMEISGVSTADYTDRDWDSYRNHSIGFVFQNYNLIPHLTVLDNVELALNLVGEDKQARSSKALKALEEVGLRNKAYKKPNQLSGGQMQRVAIARALINNPDVILADEPTGALDSETSIQIMDLLKIISKTRLVIMVTHNAELAREYSTRTIRLYDGKIVGDTNPFRHEQSSTKHFDKSASFENNANDHPHLNADAVRIINGQISTDHSPLGEKEVSEAKRGYVFDVKGEKFLAFTLGNTKLIAPYSVKLKKLAKCDFREKKAISGKEADFIEQAFGIKKQEEKKDLQKKYEIKPAMKFLTALKLSLTNLSSKKFRTLLTSIAGSIGILGIALVIGLYSGLNGFIDRQEVSLASYPITITRNTSDYESMVSTVVSALDGLDGKYDRNKVYVYKLIQQIISNQTSVNELDTELIEKLKSIDNKLYYDMYMNYNVGMNVVRKIPQKTKLLGQITTTQMYYMTIDTSRFWGQLPSRELVEEQYELIAGEYPKTANDMVLILDAKNQVSDISLFFNGIELDKITLEGYKSQDGELSNTNEESIQFEATEFIGEEYKLIPNDDYYIPSGDSYTINRTSTPAGGIVDSTAIKTINEEIRNRIGSGYMLYIYRGASQNDNVDKYDYNTKTQGSTLKISGVIKLKDDVPVGIMGTKMIGFTSALTEKIIQASAPKTDSNPTGSQVTADILNSYLAQNPNATDWQITEKMRGYGYAPLPTSVNIYCKGYEQKSMVKTAIQEISNERKAEGKSEIVCSDLMSIVLNIVEQFINIITCALLALTAISLIVSALMIGIITYVSVLERTREIGVLRALGARKLDISRIFNAETIIIGFISGIFGIILTYIISWPLASLMASLTGIAGLVSLPIHFALLLVLMSTILTFVAGLIPANIAKKKDPVKALRSE